MDIAKLYLLEIILTILAPMLIVAVLGTQMLHGLRYRYPLVLLAVLCTFVVQDFASTVFFALLNPTRTGPATFPSPTFNVLVASGVCALIVGYFAVLAIRVLAKRIAVKRAA